MNRYARWFWEQRRKARKDDPNRDFEKTGTNTYKDNKGNVYTRSS